METTARILKLLGHPDRLRILALLRQEELTVSELVSVLELSQPRVTQYVRSLEDAAIIERLREGSWVFSRLKPASDSAAARLVSVVLEHLPDNDADLGADRERLAHVRAARAVRAERFFADVANNRGRLSHEFLPQSQVEAAILEQLEGRSFGMMVDLGTGSGRMLALLADRVERGIGVDLSPDMLRVARYTLSDDRFSHLSVQQDDLRDTTLPDGVADLVTLHQVLHHLDRPSDALSEAARLLRPGGTLLVVDFAEHEREEFRDDFAHRRLGFSRAEMDRMISAQSLCDVDGCRVSVADASHPDLLIWQARRAPALETVS
ncbi:metalloregulator ArsR/SmtB family transcription factor [uncultured Algimonas sp.]|uniref:ArsR/SmtB family transcription factor n=1 Tax=uncultured Algimonas sp. TaxID=1547920 RepID=UPI00261B539E|nr:metalloregulator ArsR/SmtB family transcription factor [uncultured Algimonas sp.]